MFFSVLTTKTEGPVDSEADKPYVNKGLLIQWLQSEIILYLPPVGLQLCCSSA